MAASSTVSAPARREPAPPQYRLRRPEETVLHQIVWENLETFLERARDEERPVPRFVEREFRAFLECGILAHGFLRVHCNHCGHDRLVAFSCKGRGFCPSCGGRRMADTAARLVESILPRVPVRQWVLTLPYSLRYRLAFDAGLTRAVLNIFVRALFASLRRRARKRRPLTNPQSGAVTFIQRYGDALNLNVHFHALVLDGVYDGDPGGQVKFLPLPPPEVRDVEWIARRISRGVMRLLIRRGLGPEADLSMADSLPSEDPLLAALYGASVHSRIATGPRAGQRVLRFGDPMDVEDRELSSRQRCVTVGGFSVHGEVGVPARARRRLQRLCRYTGRPPVATQRLSRLGDGRLVYRLKRRWRDGTTHVIFEPLELLEKLAALVPPPRIHQVRYHGILGPAARERRFILPASGDPHPGKTGLPADAPTQEGSSAPKKAASRPNLPWAELIRRVFAVDVLECPRCGGRKRILAAIQTPGAIRAILEHLSLPSRAPPITPARRNQEDPESEIFPEGPEL